jgi:hypothetical protein
MEICARKMRCGTLVRILLAGHCARARACVCNQLHKDLSFPTHNTAQLRRDSSVWKSLLPQSSDYRIDFCPADGGRSFLAKRWYQNTRLHGVMFRKTMSYYSPL